jgi:hypothetical protein
MFQSINFLLGPILDLLSNTEMMTAGLHRFDNMMNVVNGIIRIVMNSIQFWIKNINLTRWFDDWWQMVKTIGGKIVDWFQGLPTTIGRVFTSIGDGIENAFKSAFNSVARAWNNTIGTLSWKVPDWVPGLGGNTVSAPRMPTWYASGGIATSPTIAGFGEAGAEALVPLDRPLSQVDPSVRGLSAIAQGLAGLGPNISEGAIVITTPATDARVIAESVLDRLVALSR